MKKLVWAFFLSFLIGEPIYLCAQTTQKPGQAPSAINKPNPNPFPKPAPQKETPLPHPRIPRPVTTAEGGIPFTLPGIVGLKEGHWVGSDNLYNLNPDISIYVELVMPEDHKFDVDEHELKARVQEIFSKAGITPNALHEPGEPLLPLYHVLVMFNEVEQCLMASCSCRLFESVNLKRVILEAGITFQAITWEKQDVISASKKDFYPLLDKTVDEITAAFVERYQYFQNLKIQRQGNR